jgi:hypothetical protein
LSDEDFQKMFFDDDGILKTTPPKWFPEEQNQVKNFHFEWRKGWYVWN